MIIIVEVDHFPLAWARLLMYHVSKLVSGSQVGEEVQLMLTNPRHAFRGQSRSSNMVGLPFDRLGIVSYRCSIVTLSLKLTVFEIFDFKKCRDLETRVRGHSRSSKPTRIDPSSMTSY